MNTVNLGLIRVTEASWKRHCRLIRWASSRYGRKMASRIEIHSYARRLVVVRA